MRKLRLTHDQAKGVTCPQIAPADEQFIYIDGDSDCWVEYRRSLTARSTAAAPGQMPAPTEGPGTELKNIFAELGINPIKDCGCEGKIEWMNRMGVAGCVENRQMIIDWLRDGQKRYSWADRAIAAANALKSRLVFKIGWTDPLPGLVDLAIERAREKADCCADGQCACGKSAAANNGA